MYQLIKSQTLGKTYRILDASAAVLRGLESVEYKHSL